MLQISTHVISLSCLLGALLGCNSQADYYIFGREGEKTAVHIQTSYHSAQARVVQQRGTQFHRTDLSFPAGWRATSREENSGLPSVIRWKPVASTKLLVFLTTTDSHPVWEYRRLAIYRYRNKSWHLLSHDFARLEFHSVGSFYAVGSDLYIWDSQYDSRYSFADPEKYVLKHYVWRNNGLVLVKARITARRYELFGIDNLSQRHQPTDDPLKEFGLKWRWWNTPAESN